MHRDLFNNINDSIVSVAYYLKHNGWRRNASIAVPAKVSGNKYPRLLNYILEPIYRIAILKKYAIQPSTKLADNRYANLIRLKTKQGHEYWLGLHNFYVITDYNHSAQYAMVVYQLAKKIKHLYHQQNI